MRKKWIGLGFAFPAIAGFILFYLIPIATMIWYSLSFGIGKREFVGLKNFVELMENEMFFLALKNTARFIFICVPTILVISLLIALGLQKITKHSQKYLTIYFYPMLLPIASIALFVHQFWDEKSVNSPKAFGILCILYIWKYFGYHTLILYARLQMIPEVYYEHANLCGAGGVAMFRYITLPLILPVLLFNVLLAVMNALKCYREAFLIGGNYPNESIYLLQHFINNNFETLNYQKISATSVLLLMAIFIPVLLVFGIYCLARRKQDV